MLQHLFIKHRLRQYHKVELTAYHDCFYRNMYEYEFITLLDIDEESASTNMFTMFLSLIISCCLLVESGIRVGEDKFKM